MPVQSPLRLIKNCRLYLERHTCRGKDKAIPHITRGVYVLYLERRRNKGKKVFEVTYIGVGGVRKQVATSGVGGRIRRHDQEKHLKPWTHYSFFEVHDNVSREEILELESLLLRIFKHDNRIQLDNVQHGGGTFKKLSKLAASTK